MSSYSDEAVAKLRTLVDIIGREIVVSPPAPAIHEAWNTLVTILALGPAPELRECPRCKGIGMRAASRCGHCWAALEPQQLPSSAVPERVEP